MQEEALLILDIMVVHEKLIVEADNLPRFATPRCAVLEAHRISSYLTRLMNLQELML